MAFWVYENWTAEQKAVIHKGSCGYCKEGRGCHEHKLANRNGKWHGPFYSLEEAKNAAKNTGRPVRPCSSTLCMNSIIKT